MGVRARQIMEAFPEFPQENIILGNAKNLVQFDIILDDAIHNVLETPATYPVLMRKPWNRKMTGLLSVNNITEFVYLVEQIISASLYRNKKTIKPSVIALVGPSGSGKTQLAEKMCSMEKFENPKTYCTKKAASTDIFRKKNLKNRIFLKKQDMQESSTERRRKI